MWSISHITSTARSVVRYKWCKYQNFVRIFDMKNEIGIKKHFKKRPKYEINLRFSLPLGNYSRVYNSTRSVLKLQTN